MLNKRIKKLRTQNNMTQKDLSDILGLTPKMISFYELGDRVPPPDILEKIADTFHVPVDFLLCRIDEIECSECAFVYSPLLDLQNIEHEKYHTKWKNAVNKFGFCLSFREAEKVRLKSIKIINSPKSGENEVFEAFDEFLHAEFSLSLRRSGFDLNHVSFEDFCPIFLQRWESKDAVSPEIYKKLIQKYGIGDSIYYHLATNKGPISEEDRLREENNELFDQLPKDKKQQALDYLKFLVEHENPKKE